jgi:hypothetical protein
MMPADMTFQDLQELIGTVQQIGNMMGMVKEKIEMLLGPCEIPRRPPSTSVDCTESGCGY